MRKYLLLLVSLYSLFCWGQRKTHLQEMKLNGEVKYLKVYEYNDKKLDFVKEYFFNRQGNIERNNNYQKGQLNSEFIYHYDDQGRFSFYEMNFYGDYAKEGKEMPSKKSITKMINSYNIHKINMTTSIISFFPEFIERKKNFLIQNLFTMT